MKNTLLKISGITLIYLLLLVFLRLPFWQYIDQQISLYIIVRRLPWITSFLIIITQFADKYTVIGILVLFTIFFFIKKEYKSILTFIAVSSFTGMINSLVKIIIQRERPIFSQLLYESSHSFPSGHSSAAFSLYGNISFYFFQKAKTKYQRIIIASIGTLFILFIGFSRLYLGVHWFTDIIGGYLTALYSMSIIYSIINIEKK